MENILILRTQESNVVEQLKTIRWLQSWCAEGLKIVYTDNIE